MLTDSRRVKDLYYVYSMAKYLDLELTKTYVSIEYLPPTVLFYACVNAVKIEQAQEVDTLKPGAVIKIVTDVNGYTEFSHAIFNSYSRPFFNVRVGNKNKQFRQEGIREIIVPLDPSSMNFF